MELFRRNCTTNYCRVSVTVN